MTLLSLPTSTSLPPKPHVHGKFIFVDGEKFFPRGVTYGPFGPCGSETEYQTPDVVERDFARIAACGMNSVRTYSISLD